MTLSRICTNGSLVAALVLLAGCAPMSDAPEDSNSDFWNPPALAEDAGDLPEGRAVIERMLEFMRSHDELAAEALLTYQAVQASGQKLHFDLLQRIAFRKADRKLLWTTLRDDGTTDHGWIANGEFTMIKQPANIYGQIKGPVAVSEMITMLTDEYGINVPFEDLLGDQATELWLGEEVTSVVYVGEAFIGGRWTDQIAIRKPGLDFELWVTKGAEPYPARIAAVLTDSEGMPSYVFDFHKYSTVLPPSESIDLEIPEDARRVDVAPIVAY
jgi:hypothetical protein